MCYNVSHMDAIFTVVSSERPDRDSRCAARKAGDQDRDTCGQAEENQLILQPITREFIDSLLGCCKGKDSLVEARERDHRIEKR